ncbi:hypothetical protein QN277_009656 [Acacia crassicarpa]|uniref:F-box domain-containing protein n=1 Tax=Acacia crassicarpa TaxID=499986 RepID=A0AAE1IQA3_9FABA|nr:hypothetical protein QN277_009656 [Acacia crassicarpa]
MKAATGGDNPYLPPEIIIDILKRLCVKSLLRFRAVCKDWRNLLKSPFSLKSITTALLTKALFLRVT